MNHDPFVGRDEELKILLSHAQSEASDGGMIDFVTGEPGAGKSRLIREYAKLQPSELVLTGQCVEGGGAPPYWPWTQVISQIASQIDLASFKKRAVHQFDYLSRFDPGTFGDLAPDRHADPEYSGKGAESQYHLFQSISEFLSYASESMFMSIILEDLHWADDGSCELLRFLVSEIPKQTIHLIGTYRNTDLGRDTPFASLVAYLQIAQHTTIHRLPGLSQSDVAALLCKLNVNGETEFLSREIIRRTDGNSLFVRVLISELGESPTRNSLAVLPEGIRHLVGRLTSKLGSDAYEVIRYAAVLGSDYPIRQLADVLKGMGFADVAQGLDAGIALNIIDPIEPGSTNYRFHHEVIRQTLLSELSLMERVRIHAACAVALEKRNERGQQVGAEELFRHFSESEGVTESRKTAKYALEAGESAMNRYDFHAARKYYSRGLKSVDREDLELYARLCFGMATGLRWSLVDPLEAVKHLETATKILIDLKKTDLLISLWKNLRVYFLHPSLIPLVQRLLPIVAHDEDLNLELNAALYFSAKVDGRPVDDKVVRCVTHGLKSIHDRNPYLMLKLHASFSSMCSETGRFRTQLAFVNRAGKLLGDDNDPRMLYLTLVLKANALIRLGRVKEAISIAYSKEEVCFSHQDSFFTRHAITRLHNLYHRNADWASVERIQAYMDSVHSFLSLTAYEWNRCEHLIERDRLDEAQKFLSSAALNWHGAYLRYLMVYPARSLMIGTSVYDKQVSAALQSDFTATSPQSCSVESIARAYLAMANADKNAVKIHLQGVRPDFSDYGWLMVGILYGFADEIDKSAEIFRKGIEKREGDIPKVAWLQFFLADILKRNSQAGAEESLDVASSMAEEHGLFLLQRRIRETSAKGSILKSARATSKYRLTQREIDVLAEVVSGKTDIEIADTLFISPKTASNHVGNILRKIDAGNRTEAAKFAIENHLLDDERALI